MPKLYVLSGPEVGKSFVIRPGDTMGRSPDRIVTLRHPSVSRQHAHFEEEDGVWYVVDEGSQNGVLFEGERTPRAGLFDAAEFSLGEIRLRFRVEEAGPTSQAAPPAASEDPLEEEIFLGGDDDEPEVPIAATAVRPVAPVAPPIRGGATAAGPAARGKAAPGRESKESDPGRRVLQYNRVDGRGGASGSDLAQYPTWVRALLVLLALALAGGIAYLSFRGTFFVKEQVRGGAPVQEP